MCGIVGYIGHRNAAQILIPGLKRLEYRGYDSAGLAVVDGDALEIRKSQGKIAKLEADLAVAPVAGTLGIAHTRWATHGIPSDRNAHPHPDSHAYHYSHADAYQHADTYAHPDTHSDTLSDNIYICRQRYCLRQLAIYDRCVD